MNFSKSMSKKSVKIVLYVIIAVMALSPLAYYIGTGYGNRDGKVSVVASVNGKDITEADLEPVFRSNYQYQQMLAAQYGTSLRGEQIETIKGATLENLIIRELMLQAAKDARIKVSSKEIDERYNQIKSLYQSEENFKQIIAQNGLTETLFKEMVKDDLLIAKMGEEVQKSAQVTDEEVKAEFEKRKENDKDLDFEKEKDGIRESLLNVKKNTLFNEWLADLRDKAEIVIHDNQMKAFFAVVEGKYDEALTLYTEAIEEDPNDPYLHVSRGNVKMIQKKYAEAISDYEKAIELFGNDPYIYLSLGLAYMQNEQNDKAVEVLKKTSELDANDIILHSSIKKLYEDMGKKDEAAEEEKIINDIQKRLEELYKSLQQQNSDSEQAEQDQED